MPLAAVAAVLLAALDGGKAMRFNPPLQQYVEARAGEFDKIAMERKQQLAQIARYVRGCVRAGQPARLTFICTHNSRRSHFAQVWARFASEYYGVPGVETFSGGTEATAFNPRAINALKRAGCDISAVESESKDNPRYQVRVSESAPPMECFSKVYSQAPNPKTDFCAVFTCSQADAACPLVLGASLRVAVPYDDPKAFDGTPEESERYDERCRQIAREMLYLLSLTTER